MSSNHSETSSGSAKTHRRAKAETAVVARAESKASLLVGMPKVSIVKQGYLAKWTNYLKGFRSRWFVLYNSGQLIYYADNDTKRLPRGAMRMETALIHRDTSDNHHFSIQNANNASPAFYLKAESASERERWIDALETTKLKAIQAMEAREEFEQEIEATSTNDDDSSANTTPAPTILQKERSLLASQLRKMASLQDVLQRNGDRLHEALTLLEHKLVEQAGGDARERLKIINDRAALFRQATNVTIKACNEFISSADKYVSDVDVILSRERHQCARLQETVKQLAQQHNNLERIAMARNTRKESETTTTPTVMVCSDSEDDANVFHDAEESLPEVSAYAGERPDEEEENGDGESTPTHSRMHRSASQQSAAAVAEEREHQRITKEYLDARIVTSPANFEEEQHDRTPRTLRTAASLISQNEADITESTSSLAHKQRRTVIPPKPSHSLSLWSIMRNCIGKELSKIPMPVNFNEPLSFLQRITEDMEYADTLLDAAVDTDTSIEQMCYVAAFAISSYSTTSNNRTTKPFNPLLGETFECDRWDDLGWRSLCEQVSHHPPVTAQHCEGKRGWLLYQEFSMTSRFRGKYLSVIPTGITHLKFADGNHYTWKRVTTTVHNIIVGKLWIDHHGEMIITNNTTEERATIKFVPYSYFSKEPPHRVTGVISDAKDQPKYMLQGAWDSHIDCMKVLASSRPGVVETSAPRRIWTKNALPDGTDKMYYMTRLALQLNEPEDNVAPTDSRLRPDQRLMEMGNWDEANREKQRLEEHQRRVRREREAAVAAGRPASEFEWQPRWFHRETDTIDPGSVIHVYNGNYWHCKQRKSWPNNLPNIYPTP